MIKFDMFFNQVLVWSRLGASSGPTNSKRPFSFRVRLFLLCYSSLYNRLLNGSSFSFPSINYRCTNSCFNPMVYGYFSRRQVRRSHHELHRKVLTSLFALFDQNSTKQIDQHKSISKGQILGSYSCTMRIMDPLLGYSQRSVHSKCFCVVSL